MIHQCALKLTEVCCQRNWIKEGDRSWCVYAMETRIGTTVFAVLLIVWSAVSTCWLETIAFVLPCYLLRQRMGGWHARTSFQCLIISISAVIVTCKLLGKAVMQLPTLGEHDIQSRRICSTDRTQQDKLSLFWCWLQRR